MSPCCYIHSMYWKCRGFRAAQGSPLTILKEIMHAWARWHSVCLIQLFVRSISFTLFVTMHHFSVQSASMAITWVNSSVRIITAGHWTKSTQKHLMQTSFFDRNKKTYDSSLATLIIDAYSSVAIKKILTRTASLSYSYSWCNLLWQHAVEKNNRDVGMSKVPSFLHKTFYFWPSLVLN